VSKTKYMQHFDDDTRSEIKHIRALIEVNKCVCVCVCVRARFR